MSDLDRQVAEALKNQLFDPDDCFTWPYRITVDGAEHAHIVDKNGKARSWHIFEPSTNWQQCGELIERFKISLAYAPQGWYIIGCRGVGYCKTPQEAVCRAVIALCKEDGE